MPNLTDSPLPALRAPGGFVPVHALAVGDGNGRLVPVDAALPLPTANRLPPAIAPLAGQAAHGTAHSPAFESPGGAVWLALAGDWSGQVRIERSADNGASWHALGAGAAPWPGFTTNGTEAIADDSVARIRYRLAFAVVSGTCDWSLGQ